MGVKLFRRFSDKFRGKANNGGGINNEGYPNSTISSIKQKIEGEEEKMEIQMLSQAFGNELSKFIDVLKQEMSSIIT